MPYLNSDVFYHALPADACELVPLTPRAMSAAFERGELDAGPLPIVDVLRLGESLAPIEDLCVATRRASVSILLFSQAPAGDLDGARIAVTDHTSTSLQLLRVLLAERWRVEPAALVRLSEPADAVLLIGDPALRQRDGIDGYPHVYDLGREWFDHTGGLPFVYARWVARADAEARAIAAFARALSTAFEAGVARLDEIAEGRPELGMTTAEKLRYLKGFVYRMGDAEHRSVARFAASLAELPRWQPQPAPTT